VALGNFTKQLAQQAIGNSAKSVLDALRPSDMPKVEPPAAAEAGPPENIGAAILAEVRAMQTALKDDAELVVLYYTGFETLRVLEFFSPSAQVMVLIGIDTERNLTRVVARADSVQLTCKVMKVQPEGKATRIVFREPRPKAS